MPEIPEITSRAKEIKQHLAGKSISKVEVLQPKCLNITTRRISNEFDQDATIIDATHRGKWIQVKLTSGWLLLKSWAWEGDLLLTDRAHMPDKYRHCSSTFQMMQPA